MTKAITIPRARYNEPAEIEAVRFFTPRLYLPEPVWTRDPISTTALKLIALLFMFAGLGGLLSVWGN